MKTHAPSKHHRLPVIMGIILMILLGMLLLSMPIRVVARPTGTPVVINVSAPTLAGVRGVYTVDQTEKLILIEGNPTNNDYIKLTGTSDDTNDNYTVAVAEGAGTASSPIHIVLDNVSIASDDASPLHLRKDATVVLDLEQNSDNIMRMADIGQPQNSVFAAVWVDGADVTIVAPEPASGATIGKLTATGGTNAAGIGGQKSQTTAINLTIENGEIHATGGSSAAGIGSGFSHSKGTNITINGGKVVAIGGKFTPDGYSNIPAGAGIGSASADKGDPTSIKISGGTIQATGGEGGRSDPAAGIGAGGAQENDVLIDITGGNITATAGKGSSAAGIGGANDMKRYKSLTINIDGKDTVVKASGSEIGGCGIGSGTSASDRGSININIKGGDITATGTANTAVDNPPTGSGIGIAGLLPAEAVLNINITGGKIRATGSEFAAGIGSAENHLGKLSIVIEDGEIIANGGKMGAGIGTGAQIQKPYGTAFNTSILIKGGTILATGGADAAGIGGGKHTANPSSLPASLPLNIQIQDGDISAIGGTGGAGIGAGADTASEGSGGVSYTKIVTVELTGGDIHAVAGEKRNYPDSRIPDAVGSGDCVDLQMAITLGQYINLLAVSQGDVTKETRAVGISTISATASTGYIIEGTVTPKDEDRTLEIWNKHQEKQQGGLLPAGYRDVAVIVNHKGTSDLWLELLSHPDDPAQPEFLGWLTEDGKDAMTVPTALTRSRVDRKPIDLVLTQQVTMETWTVADNIQNLTNTEAIVQGTLKNHRGTNTFATLTYWDTTDLDSKISKKISVQADGTFSIPLKLQEGREYTVELEATLVPNRRLFNPGELTFTTLGDTAIIVTFNPTGGQWADASTTPRSRSVNPNTLVTPPTPNPTKTQHAFLGWFTEETGGVKWDFATPLDPANGDSLLLFAQWEWSESLTINVSFVLEEVEVNRRTTIPEPTPPPKANHKFIGWFTAPEGGEKWDFSTLVDPAEANMALFARWEESTDAPPPATVAVKFDPNGGKWSDNSTTPKDVEVTRGQPLAVPTSTLTPPTPGQSFLGWFDGNDQVTFPITNTTNSPANTTVKAKWSQPSTPTVAVKFDPNGGKWNDNSTASKEVTVTRGQPLDVPAFTLSPPTPEQTFLGWFDGNDHVPFPITNTTNSPATTTVKAKWSATTPSSSPSQQFTVTFDPGNGAWSNNPTTGNRTQKVDKGAKVAQPAPLADRPATDNVRFVGWVTADDVIWNFDHDTVTKHITLTARWASERTPRRGVNGEALEPLRLREDGSGRLPKPADPTPREHRRFKGWFTAPMEQVANEPVAQGDGVVLAATSDEPARQWDFDNDIAFEGLVLYAHDEWILHHVQFNPNGGTWNDGGTETKNQSVRDGALATAPGTVTRQGYTFAGWYVDGGGAWNTTTPITVNTKVYANWTNHANSHSTPPPNSWAPWPPTVPPNSTPSTSTSSNSTPSSSTSSHALPGSAISDPSDSGKVLPDGDNSNENSIGSGTTGDNGSTSPTTGDTTVPLLILLCTGLFATAGVATFRLRRKEQQNDEA